MYLPRQPVLECMMGRCQKNCPDFFDKYMKFHTSVESVQYLEQECKFQVVTKNVLTGEQVTDLYDKCIWSAGENGRPSMPGPLVKLFEEGGFQGRVIHSSDTADFENDCKDKRILLIGGSYSAEDLALMYVPLPVRTKREFSSLLFALFSLMFTDSHIKTHYVGPLKWERKRSM